MVGASGPGVRDEVSGVSLPAGRVRTAVFFENAAQETPQRNGTLGNLEVFRPAAGGPYAPAEGAALENREK